MTIVELVKDYFKTEGWLFSQVEDKNVFLFGINGENGKFQCLADIFDEEKFFSFYSICGFNTPESKKQEMAELITRLNYEEGFGNFEMDFEDGEIRYKTSIFYESLEPTTQFVKNIIIQNIMSMDDSLPALTGLAFQNMTPIDAFKLVEEIETKKENKTL